MHVLVWLLMVLFRAIWFDFLYVNLRQPDTLKRLAFE